MNGAGVDENGNDIDECQNNAGMTVGICNNGRCSNMMKDFKCICNNGFKNPEDSNKLCVGKNRTSGYDFHDNVLQNDVMRLFFLRVNFEKIVGMSDFYTFLAINQ